MSNHRYSRFIPLLFLGFDLFSINVGFIAGFWLKFENLDLERHYVFLWLILNFLWVLTFFSARLQHANRESGLIDHLNRLNTALVVNLAVVFALWFVAKPFYLSRQHLFFTYLIFSIFCVGWRIIWYYAIRYYRAHGYNYRSVVVVGFSRISQKLVDYFKNNPGFGYRFLGYFDNSISGEHILGRTDNIPEFGMRNKIDIIYAYLPGMNDDQIKFLVDYAENNLIQMKIISQFSKLGLNNLSIQNHGTIPVVNITEIPLDNRINQIVKRAFDIVFSFMVMLLVLSWLIPLIGLLIKIESKGPVLFKQPRNGLNNNKFNIYKFRTMYVHDDSKVIQAKKGDSRITRLGSFLRKTSLDEFPQFLNVFAGDMSVVGPRPHAIKHNEEFQKKIDRFVQRHAVKPGITGLAQAKGFRGETATFNDISGRVRLDRFYVKNWSIFLDFKIIFLTFVSFLRGSEKAY